MRFEPMSSPTRDIPWNRDRNIPERRTAIEYSAIVALRYFKHVSIYANMFVTILADIKAIANLNLELSQYLCSVVNYDMQALFPH